MSAVESLLGAVYERIPKSVRPLAKRVFVATTIRAEAILRGRRLCKGDRVAFVDCEVADLEPYEFLGPGYNELTVRTRHTLVSPGTETAVLCGLPGARRHFPYYPGYSAAAEVELVGKGVKGIKPGDRVAGRVPHAGRATVPAANVFLIPDKVDDPQAAFIELGIIVLQGLRKAGVRPGDKVLVLGQGLIGQMCNRLLRSMGAGEIIACATSRRREKTAMQSDAADRFLVFSENDRPESVNADVVIEAVGSPPAIVTAIRCAKAFGKVVLLGSARGISRDFGMSELVQARGIRVVGAHIGAMPAIETSAGRWTYAQEGRLFLEMLEAGMISMTELVTWNAKPDEANAVYECLANGGGNQVGIVFDWQRNGGPGHK